MAGIEYVNLNGARVAVDHGAAASPSRRPAQDAYHKGWRVLGFSPEHLETARRLHEKSADAHKLFDEQVYMRANKPGALRSKPYSLAQAAEQCAAMAERSGWKGVRVVEVAKGAR